MDNHDSLPKTMGHAKEAGSKTYFTGKPCKHGHVAPRRTDSRICVECLVKRCQVWRAANPEKHRAAVRSWKAANPDKVIEMNRAWRPANIERARELDRDWRAANLERARETARAWALANPDKVRQNCHNQRARKRGAEGKCSAEEAAAIRAAQKDRCAYCQVKLRGGGHLDHIVPLARGGSNFPRNLQWLCQPCNQSKHAADPIEFARKTGRLI